MWSSSLSIQLIVGRPGFVPLLSPTKRFKILVFTSFLCDVLHYRSSVKISGKFVCYVSGEGT